jgi:hypothetical protein
MKGAPLRITPYKKVDKKTEAQARITGIQAELREYVQKKIHEIEDIANEHGIIVGFTGLPPFDTFGNSGYYFPVDENGSPWYSSDIKNDYYPLEYREGAPEGWLSSDAGC